VIRGTRVALALLALSLGAAGCGGDSSGGDGASSVSVPAVTSPSVSNGASTSQTATSVKTTKGGKTYNPGAPDAQGNDVPPPKGGPQEAFEQQCKRNPSACR
jgi:ABC-type glycerol-3-phosphate transport system substrate-binding protein